MLFSYFNYIFNIWEWFNVNGYHLVMLSGVNTLRYMHILKEMRNFKWVFLEAVFKWVFLEAVFILVWPKRFIWVWADGRLCNFGDHPLVLGRRPNFFFWNYPNVRGKSEIWAFGYFWRHTSQISTVLYVMKRCGCNRRSKRS